MKLNVGGTPKDEGVRPKYGASLLPEDGLQGRKVRLEIRSPSPAKSAEKSKRFAENLLSVNSSSKSTEEPISPPENLSDSGSSGGPKKVFKKPVLFLAPEDSDSESSHPETNEKGTSILGTVALGGSGRARPALSIEGEDSPVASAKFGGLSIMSDEDEGASPLETFEDIGDFKSLVESEMSAVIANDEYLSGEDVDKTQASLEEQLAAIGVETNSSDQIDMKSMGVGMSAPKMIFKKEGDKEIPIAIFKPMSSIPDRISDAIESAIKEALNGLETGFVSDEETVEICQQCLNDLEIGDSSELSDPEVMDKFLKGTPEKSGVIKRLFSTRHGSLVGGVAFPDMLSREVLAANLGKVSIPPAVKSTYRGDVGSLHKFTPNEGTLSDFPPGEKLNSLLSKLDSGQAHKFAVDSIDMVAIDQNNGNVLVTKKDEESYELIGIDWGGAFPENGQLRHEPFRGNMTWTEWPVMKEPFSAEHRDEMIGESYSEPPNLSPTLKDSLCFTHFCKKQLLKSEKDSGDPPKLGPNRLLTTQMEVQQNVIDTAKDLQAVRGVPEDGRIDDEDFLSALRLLAENNDMTVQQFCEESLSKYFPN